VCHPLYSRLLQNICYISDSKRSIENVIFLQSTSLNEGECDNQQSCESGDGHTTPVCIKPTKKRCKAKVDLASVANECLNEIRRLPEDPDKDQSSCHLDADDVYGQHIAAEMRKISNELLKQIVKGEIQSILIKAHLGCFNSVSQCQTPQPATNTQMHQWLPAQSSNWFPTPHVKPCTMGTTCGTPVPAPSVSYDVSVPPQFETTSTLLGQVLQSSTYNASLGAVGNADTFL